MTGNDRLDIAMNPRPLMLSCVVATAAILLTTTPASAQRVWVEQGPGPNTLGQVENITNREVAGAINAVATHPTDANVIFVGAVNGGIWRTGNG